MFNDKYGLTQAVLEGRKTQTRRICNPIPYRRELTCNDVWGHYPTKEEIDFDKLLARSKYKVGEVIAVAQSYHALNKQGYVAPEWLDHTCENSAGYDNKMFVQAALMPYHIKITNIRVECLQDISDEDCMKEGVIPYNDCFGNGFMLDDPHNNSYRRYCYTTARKAFSVLIDKTCGKGTWDSNPWVFVYDFEEVCTLI